MSVKEYSLKFSILCRYAPPLLSIPNDEMSQFVTDVVDLVREECRTVMFMHGVFPIN